MNTTPEQVEDQKTRPVDTDAARAFLPLSEHDLHLLDVKPMAAEFYDDLAKTFKSLEDIKDLPEEQKDQKVHAKIEEHLIAGLDALNPDKDADLSPQVKQAIEDLFDGPPGAANFAKRFDERREDILDLLLQDEGVQVALEQQAVVDRIREFGDSIGANGFITQFTNMLSSGRITAKEYEPYYKGFDKTAEAFDHAMKVAYGGGFDDPRQPGEPPSYGVGGATQGIADIYGIKDVNEVQSFEGGASPHQAAAFFASTGDAPEIFVGEGNLVKMDFVNGVLPLWEEQKLFTFEDDAARAEFAAHIGGRVSAGILDPEDLALSAINFAKTHPGVKFSVEGYPDPANYEQDMLEESRRNYQEALSEARENAVIEEREAALDQEQEIETAEVDDPVSSAGAVAYLAGESGVGPFMSADPAETEQIASVSYVMQMQQQAFTPDPAMLPDPNAKPIEQGMNLGFT